MSDREIDETIETIMDRIGIKQLLEHISTICAEKAEHVRVNWQDYPLAKHWDHCSRIIDTADSAIKD